MSILPWYVGVIFSMAEFFAMHHVSRTCFALTPAHLQWTKIVTRVLLNKDSYTGTVNQSPYFAGIIAASMLWVGYGWITRLVKGNVVTILPLVWSCLTFFSRTA